MAAAAAGRNAFPGQPAVWLDLVGMAASSLREPLAAGDIGDIGAGVDAQSTGSQSVRQADPVVGDCHHVAGTAGVFQLDVFSQWGRRCLAGEFGGNHLGVLPPHGLAHCDSGHSQRRAAGLCAVPGAGSQRPAHFDRCARDGRCRHRVLLGQRPAFGHVSGKFAARATGPHADHHGHHGA